GHRHRVRPAARELVGYVTRVAARALARSGTAEIRCLFLRPDADAGGYAERARSGIWRVAEGRSARDGAAVVPGEPAASLSRRHGGSRSRLERAGRGQWQRRRRAIRRAVHPCQLHAVRALRARPPRHVEIPPRRRPIGLRQPATCRRLGIHGSRRRRRVRGHRRDAGGPGPHRRAARRRRRARQSVVATAKVRHAPLKTAVSALIRYNEWWAQQDSNLRPPGSELNAGCLSCWFFVRLARTRTWY